MSPLLVYLLLISAILFFPLRAGYRSFRFNRCPQCYWGKLRVLCAAEIDEAIRNGNHRTAVRVFSCIHVRCRRCDELYLRRPDWSLERTELPIAAKDKERI